MHPQLVFFKPDGQFRGGRCLAVVLSNAILAIVLMCPVAATEATDETAKPSFQDLLACDRATVADELHLTSTQRDKIGLVVAAFQSRLAQIQRGYPPGAQDMEGFAIRRKLLAELRRLREKTAQEISALLSAEQNSALAKMAPGASTITLPASDIVITETRFDHTARLPSAADGQFILKVNYSKAQVCDATTGSPIGSPLYHAEERLIHCSVFSPDGKLVATGTRKIPSEWTLGRERGDEGEVRVWNAATGQLLACKAFRCSVSDIMFLGDNKTVQVKTDPINGR